MGKKTRFPISNFQHLRFVNGCVASLSLTTWAKLPLLFFPYRFWFGSSNKDSMHYPCFPAFGKMLVAKSQQDFIQFFLFDIRYSLTNKEFEGSFQNVFEWWRWCWQLGLIFKGGSPEKIRILGSGRKWRHMSCSPLHVLMSFNIIPVEYCVFFHLVPRDFVWFCK